MRTYFIALFLVCFSLPALAQTEEKITFGVGVSYFPAAIPGDAGYLGGNFSTAGLTDFFFPMQFGPYFRFEPEFGLYFKSYQEQDSSASAGAFLRTANQQIVRAGFGVFYTKQVDSVFQFGIGARLGILSSEYETHQAAQGVSDTDIHLGVFYLGGAFSVEYFISRHFSIGGELQFIHYGFGAPLVTVGTDQYSGYLSPDTPEQGVWSTNEVLSARFWF